MNWNYLRRYQKYDLRYDFVDKILFIYKAMRDYELEIKDIRIVGRGRK